MAASLQKAVGALRRWLSCQPILAIVLGSGFQDAGARDTILQRLPYARIPGFPRPGVAGHAGELLVARHGRGVALLLAGRSHYYEGHDMDTVTFPVRALAGLGIRDLLLTNAAGGIRRGFRPGDLMMITDHINAMGVNPLRGRVPPGCPRFPDMTSAYSPDLARLLRRAARTSGVRLRAGVYLAVSGPSYETPAEIRAFRRLGADAVGMSTVPEVLVARQLGLRVAGLSCITNLAAGLGKGPLAHAEVLAAGQEAAARSSRLLREFIGLHGDLQNISTGH